MSKKKTKYKPTGKFIGIDTGFIQAATLLDLAALDAVESKDYERAASIARQWIELSISMKHALSPESGGEFDEDEEGDLESDHSPAPIGFGVTAQQLKEHHGRTK